MVHPVKERNMRELAAYQQTLWRHPCLQYLFFEVTDRCNMHCLHCGSGCNSSNHTNLPYPVIVETLHKAAKAYNPHRILVCLTGGEPMLYPDLYRVVRAAHDMGFAVGITSNGTLINADAACRLLHAGLDTISVSIDGIGSTHDAFRCSEGSFEKALNGIRQLNDLGISVQPLTVVHKKNLLQLERLYDLFVSEKVYSWRLTTMDPIGRGKRNADLLLSGAEMRRLLEFVRSRRFDSDHKMEVTMSCSHFMTYEYEHEIRDNYFQCGAGTKVASVMANGDIGACLDIERRPELIQGNIYTDDFIDVWENRFEAFRKDRTEDSTVCKDCKYREVCMGDSAHTWDYDRNAPDYCVFSLLEEDESVENQRYKEGIYLVGK